MTGGGVKPLSKWRGNYANFTVIPQGTALSTQNSQISSFYLEPTESVPRLFVWAERVGRLLLTVLQCRIAPLIQKLCHHLIVSIFGRQMESCRLGGAKGLVQELGEGPSTPLFKPFFLFESLYGVQKKSPVTRHARGHQVVVKLSRPAISHRSGH